MEDNIQFSSPAPHAAPDVRTPVPMYSTTKRAQAPRRAAYCRYTDKYTLYTSPAHEDALRRAEEGAPQAEPAKGAPQAEEGLIAGAVNLPPTEGSQDWKAPTASVAEEGHSLLFHRQAWHTSQRLSSGHAPRHLSQHGPYQRRRWTQKPNRCGNAYILQASLPRSFAVSCCNS